MAFGQEYKGRMNDYYSDKLDLDNDPVWNKEIRKKRKVMARRVRGSFTKRQKRGLLKSRVKSIFGVARKLKRSGKKRKAIQAYGLAMKKVGFLQGVHRRKRY